MRVVFAGVELAVVGSSEERREEHREQMRGRGTWDTEGIFCATPRCQCLVRTQRMVRERDRGPCYLSVHFWGLHRVWLERDKGPKNTSLESGEGFAQRAN